MKKIRKSLENYTEKTRIFHEKSTPNRVKKLSQTKHAIKITQKIRPAALWRSTGRFLVNLGSPRGPQNRRFGVRHSGFDRSWNQPGSILGAKLHFLGFWLFFLRSGSIWGCPGLHFGLIFIIFLPLFWSSLFVLLHLIVFMIFGQFCWCCGLLCAWLVCFLVGLVSCCFCCFCCWCCWCCWCCSCCWCCWCFWCCC